MTIDTINIKSKKVFASYDKLSYFKVIDTNDKCYYGITYDNEVISFDNIDIYDDFTTMLILYRTMKDKGDVKCV